MALVEQALDDVHEPAAVGNGAVSLGALERSAGLLMRIARLTVFERFFAAKMIRSDRQALAMPADDELARFLTLTRRIAGWPPAEEVA